jgi:hypothetical protein
MFDRIESKLATGLNPIDKRGTLEGSLHRFSGITDRSGIFTGLTIRLARAVFDAARNITPLLFDDVDIEQLEKIPAPGATSRGGFRKPVSMLVIGQPGTGKTTELRAMIYALQKHYGPHVVVVDTSGDVSGGSSNPHPIMGYARVMPVADPSEQHLVIGEAIANHSPWMLVLDEMKYDQDAARVEEAAQKCPVLCTVHGRDLRSVLQNKLMRSVIGNVDYQTMRRTTEPVFDVAIVAERGYYIVYPQMRESIDALLRGEPDQGIFVARGAMG